MTQSERVLAAAERPDGVCQAEYLEPDRYGLLGARITRLAARIQDLERAGYLFECVGWRKRCKVYRLVVGPHTGGWGDPPLHAPHVGGSAQDSRTALAPSASVRARLFEPAPEPHWKSEAA